MQSAHTTEVVNPLQAAIAAAKSDLADMQADGEALKHIARQRKQIKGLEAIAARVSIAA